MQRDTESAPPSEAWSTRGGCSFDHLVGTGEQCRWYFDPECFRRLEVDNKFVLGRPLHRHVGGLLASEDAIDVTRRSPVVVQQVGSKREQAAVHGEEARGIDGGQSMTCS